MKASPPRIRKYGVGRPAEDGDRYPSGKLRPPGPTREAVEKRRAMLQDVTWGTNPIDASRAAGWITPMEFAAARAYLRLRRRAYGASVGPRLAQASCPEVEIVEIGVSGDKVSNWSRKQIAEVFDLVFSEDAQGPEAREEADAKAAKQLKDIHAAMTDWQRRELIQVCVRESWPQWFVQRKAGEAIREKAKAENRGLTDAEQARIYKRFHSSFERQRDLLIGALRIMVKATMPDAVVAPALPYDTPEPAPYIPADNRGFERTDYVDRYGDLQFVAERKR